MFKTLINEAVISYRLCADGPVLINSGEAAKVDPTKPDLFFVRTTRGGEQIAYLPGSSLKGVFRTRYEQLGRVIGGQVRVCDPLPHIQAQNCNISIRSWARNAPPDQKTNGKALYQRSCFACRLFGNLSIAGRIRFTDAYPAGDITFGIRNGVAINRITGAADGGKLFTYEVVEQGTFSGKIHLTNYQPYQLLLILWILKDIDDGLITLGMGGSRGNGKMRLDGDCDLTVRQYDGQHPGLPEPMLGDAKTGVFGREWTIDRPEKMLDTANFDDVREKVLSEGWGDCNAG